MVEGARLERVFTGNRNVGSNPTLSAQPRLNFFAGLCDARPQTPPGPEGSNGSVTACAKSGTPFLAPCLTSF